MADDVHPGLVPLYGSSARAARGALLEEIRLLRRMGDDGRRVAVLALRSARLGPRPEHPGHAATGAAAPTNDAVNSVTPDDALKFYLHNLDAAIVQRGGASIFAAKPRGTLSAEAEARLEAWQWLTPKRHADATGVKPMEGPERRRVLPGQPLPPLPEGKR